MKIVYTPYLDITEKNADEVRISLFNKIIKSIAPVINEYQSEKEKRVAIIRDETKKIKIDIEKLKKTLQELIDRYERQVKISKILSRVEKIFQAGLAYGSTKNELVIMLKILDKLPNEKLDYQISNLMEILGKGFRKVT